MPDDRFDALLRLLEQHEGITDELAFFTADTHAPLPLDVIEARSETLAGRLSAARSHGYRAGVDVISTIGHHAENVPNSLSGDYTFMTDMEGNVCLGTLCPNDELARAYVRDLYEIVVATGPDFIWIDDDIRLFDHIPILYGCFCDNCLSIFRQESGLTHTRESLRQGFNRESVGAALELRKAWLQHNRNTFVRLLELIEATAHGMRPDLTLGLCAGDRFFEGYDLDNWAEILSGRDKGHVMWRPGAVWFNDDNIAQLVAKAHCIGRQVSVLSDSVVSIQSEIENFPYQCLRKGTYVTGLEAASHMAAGCTGAAFNVLPIESEPLDEFEPLLDGLRNMRPFYDLLAQHLGRTRPVGIYAAWGKDAAAASHPTGGDWPGDYRQTPPGDGAAELLELGLPVAYSPEHSRVTVLSEDYPLVMDEQDIAETLSSGVYMDAQALAALNRMGYGELTGFDVERLVEEDGIEVFVDHPLNAGYAGRRRNGRQTFWRCTAGALRPTHNGSQALARMVDYTGAEISPCCLGVFENKLGGRVCVAGYCPRTFLLGLPKTSQLKSLMRWLSRDALPAYVDSYHKANLWVRETPGGGVAAVLLNRGFDPAENLTLALRADAGEIRVYGMDCTDTTTSRSGTDGHHALFVLPSIEPLGMRLITAARGAGIRDLVDGSARRRRR